MQKQTLLKPFNIVVQWRLRYKIIAFILLSAFSLVVFWLFPRQVQFSYSQPNCLSHWIIAPDIYRSTDKDGFKAVVDDQIRIGGIGIASTKVCVEPTRAPQIGVSYVGLAPFGWNFGASNMSVKIGKAPVASVQPLKDKVPVNQRLELPLSSPDKIFKYKLAANKKQVDCKTLEHSISCDLTVLSLEQDKKYTATLAKYFNNNKVATISKITLQTLKATTVVKSSIQSGEKVFSKPESILLTFDKLVKSAKAELVQVEGDKRTPIETETTLKDSVAEIAWTVDLPRAAHFELKLVEFTAIDGSTLVEPYVLGFELSGGPKVVGVNVGNSQVPQGATVVLTFDQPLSASQSYGQSIVAAGGAQLTTVRDNQAFISTANVPKCGDFSITVSDTILSNYGVSGGSAWKYSGRIVCHTVVTIGTSVQGRSIPAYYFGSGPNVVIYVGAIHGTEYSTRSLMYKWIDELEAGVRAIPADKTVIVIPAINPDGIVNGTRTNANNVDLNRNFDVSDWKSDITHVDNSPFPGGGGSQPMSEPETKALASLVEQTKPRLVLSYHSVGGVVAANQFGDSGLFAATYASLSGYGNITGSTSSVFEYQITGTSDDYFAEKLSTRSVLIELGSSSYHQIERNRNAMWAMLNS